MADVKVSSAAAATLAKVDAIEARQKAEREAVAAEKAKTAVDAAGAPAVEDLGGGVIRTMDKNHPEFQKVILADPAIAGRAQRITVYPGGSYALDM